MSRVWGFGRGGAGFGSGLVGPPACLVGFGSALVFGLSWWWWFGPPLLSLFFPPSLACHPPPRHLCFGGGGGGGWGAGRRKGGCTYIAIIHSPFIHLYIYIHLGPVCLYICFRHPPVPLRCLFGPWAGPGGSNAAAAAAFHNGGGSRPRPPPFVYIHANRNFFCTKRGEGALAGEWGLYRKTRRTIDIQGGGRGSRTRCQAERKPQRGGKTHGHGRGRGPKRMHAYMEMKKKTGRGVADGAVYNVDTETRKPQLRRGPAPWLIPRRTEFPRSICRAPLTRKTEENEQRPARKQSRNQKQHTAAFARLCFRFRVSFLFLSLLISSYITALPKAARAHAILRAPTALLPPLSRYIPSIHRWHFLICLSFWIPTNWTPSIAPHLPPAPSRRGNPRPLRRAAATYHTSGRGAQAKPRVAQLSLVVLLLPLHQLGLHVLRDGAQDLFVACVGVNGWVGGWVESGVDF